MGHESPGKTPCPPCLRTNHRLFALSRRKQEIFQCKYMIKNILATDTQDAHGFKNRRPPPSSPGQGARRAGASRRPCAAPLGPRGPSGPRARGAGGPEDRKASTAALPNPCASVCIRGQKKSCSSCWPRRTPTRSSAGIRHGERLPAFTATPGRIHDPGVWRWR